MRDASHRDTMSAMMAHAIVCLAALALAACSQEQSAGAPPQETAKEEIKETPASAPPAADAAAPVERVSEQVASADFDNMAPGAGAPAGAPAAPSSTAYGNPLPPGFDGVPGLAGTGNAGSGQGAPPPVPMNAPPIAAPTAADDGGGPSAIPPAAANGHGPAAAPAAANGAPKNGHAGSKVLSYFQKARTRIDADRAFGFVLMPKRALNEQDKRVQKDFCETVLATMDFMTPSAVAASAPREVLATYWPVVGSRESFEIKYAFTERNCDDLIAWYDYTLARALAAKAGVAELSGPLLITWPSAGAEGNAARDPLIVDFSKANPERAAKALRYWFRQVKARPELWTNRIREGTIRAELADAVNDTAGVLLTVLAGKWESFTVVASASP